MNPPVRSFAKEYFTAVALLQPIMVFVILIQRGHLDFLVLFKVLGCINILCVYLFIVVCITTKTK